MLSKRDLGIGYFLGTGMGLIVSLIGYLLLVDPAADVLSLGTITALGFAGSLPFLGYWLRHSDLGDSAVWSVARWCGLGLLIPSLIAATVLLLGFRPRVVLRFPHLLANLVAAGGAVGAVFGLVVELRREQARAAALNRRNSLLNLIMRHDIRNDVNVIRGYSELLADRLDAPARDLLRPIEAKSDQIMETSRLAERIQSIEDDPDRRPVDVVTIVADRVDDAREAHPEATVDTDLPDAAWAQAGELLRTAIGNLIENAIEHHDGEPWVGIAVEAPSAGPVQIRITDDGPGIPESIRGPLLAEGAEIDDGPGLGLWLVKWVVAGYGGEFSVVPGDRRGTVAEITLPAAPVAERGDPPAPAGSEPTPRGANRP